MFRTASITAASARTSRRTGLLARAAQAPRLSVRPSFPLRSFAESSLFSAMPRAAGVLPAFDDIRAATRTLTNRSCNPEHATMQERIRASLNEKNTFDRYVPALNRMLEYIGLDAKRSPAMCSIILGTLVDDRPLDAIEKHIYGMLQQTIVDPISNCNFIDAIGPKLAGRSQIIFSQIEPYLQDMRGREILDFGAGNGLVMDEVRRRISANTRGINVRPYGEGILQYDGKHAPFTDGRFDCVIVTNVFHHEKNNQQCLDEVRRLLVPGGKLIVIETVPTGDTDDEARQDLGRTFLIDFTYNRLFNHADIPVPGTFETAEGWKKRFTNSGFGPLDVFEQLGFDQEIVPDWHVLYVTRKPGG